MLHGRVFSLVNAGIAQLVEQLICNQQVVGSNPTAGSNLKLLKQSNLCVGLIITGGATFF
jgi:hypothetical protein